MPPGSNVTTTLLIARCAASDRYDVTAKLPTYKKRITHMKTFLHFRSSISRSPLRWAFALIAFADVSLSPPLRAVSPPPDGGYPGGNTAKGQNALLRLTAGTFNTAVGLFSLESLTDGKFNTGIGAVTLLSNTADQNTATGAGALFSNTSGFANTANGAFALFSNTTGGGNTATG